MEPLCSGHLLPLTFLAQRVSEPHGCFRCHLYNELFWIKCCYGVPGRPASVVLDIFLTDETVNEVFRDFTNKANSAPERHSRHKWRTRRRFSRLPNTSNYQSWNCRICVSCEFVFRKSIDWFLCQFLGFCVLWISCQSCYSMKLKNCSVYDEHDLLYCFWNSEQLLSRLLLSSLTSGIIQSDLADGGGILMRRYRSRYFKQHILLIWFSS